MKIPPAFALLRHPPFRQGGRAEMDSAPTVSLNRVVTNVGADSISAREDIFTD